MDMSEKVVVITGASMGIGEAIAKLFADHGAAIVFSSRDQTRAEAARARVAPQQPSLAVACDVCDAAQISALLRATLERFGRVDVWVNNAGFGLIDSIEHMERQAYRRMFETNLFGAIEAMQQVIPVMKRQKSGCIINISSVAGYIAVPYMGAYGATKRALNAISRAARLELEGSGVSVVNICPGVVNTSFGDHAVHGAPGMRISAAFPRGVAPERVAQAVLRAYQHDITETVVPWTNRLAIGLAFLAPFVVNFAIRRMLKKRAKAAAA
jgi:short-subunit dehydrogenase